jgi:DNA invertase Pin-like site-specific DNA recombinase
MSSKDLAPSRVYSYARFSTPEQKEGHSKRRQDEVAEAWAKRKGCPLDTSLKMTDEGLSGYHGLHRTKGALGRFLKAVEDGRVPPGSVLLIENLDRLGREAPSTTLRKTIFKLWDHGITLQSLSPEQSYQPGCDQKPEFIVLILYLQRAWDESERKSSLSKSNWAEKQRQARDEGRIVTGSVPAWIAVEYDHSDPQRPKAIGRTAIPEAAAVVRQIFEMKSEGIGYGTIVRKLNAEALWLPPLKKGGGRRKKDGMAAKRQQTTGWRISYVKKIILNRAVLGEYQPYVRRDGKRIPAGDVIQDYFPAVVEPELFNGVQAVLKGNRRKGGRIAKCANLLAHLAKCPYCGGPMAFCDRGARGSQWLICDNGRNAARCEETGKPKCSRFSMKYAECESLLLDNCAGLKPEQVLPNPDEHARLCAALRQRIKGKCAELDSVGRQTANLVDQIARTDNPTIRDRYEARVRELDERIAALTAEKVAAEADLGKAESGVQSFAAWQRTFKTLKKSLAQGDVELRLKMRTHLRELIDKIEVFAVGGQKYRPMLEDHTGKGKSFWWFDNDHKLPEAQAKRFVAWMNCRLATREGRFIRVYFKNLPELPLDLAPDGSLASHFVLARPEEAERDPDRAWLASAVGFDQLWKEFEAAKGRGRKRQLVN